MQRTLHRRKWINDVTIKNAAAIRDLPLWGWNINCIGEILVPQSGSPVIYTYRFCCCSWSFCYLKFLRKELFLYHVLWFLSDVVLRLLMRVSKDKPKLSLLTKLSSITILQELDSTRKNKLISWSFLVKTFPFSS